MRTLAISVLVGPLVLLCSGVTFAQPAAPPGTGVSVPYVGDGTSTGDRQTYAQKARGDLRAWQAKLAAFDARARKAGTAAAKDADRDLHATWHRMQAASARLGHVGARGWEGARSSYEKASDDLARSWQKINPDKT